jgi:hypothetical protein
MTQRTRYFLLGSSLVLIVGLCTGLVAYYNGSLPVRSSTVGPAELAYVPAGATAVAYANVHDVMNSDFRKRLHQAIPTGEEKDKLQQELGLDIEHDIDSVVAGYTGSMTTGNGASKEGIVLVRGRFNAAKIEAEVTQHGGAAQQYGNKKMFVMSEDHPNGQGADASGQAAVAILEPTLLALGNLNAVKKAIDAGSTGQNVTKNADLMKYVGDLSGSNTAWAVGKIEGVGTNTDIPQQARDQLANIQWCMVSAHIDGGVSGMARAIARDDQAGDNLRDVVRGGLAAARLMAGKDARIDAVINSVQVTGTGKDVGITFVVPNEVLDMINGLAGLNHLQQSGSAAVGKK